jgi:hypothetical protein
MSSYKVNFYVVLSSLLRAMQSGTMKTERLILFIATFTNSVRTVLLSSTLYQSVGELHGGSSWNEAS